MALTQKSLVFPTANLSDGVNGFSSLNTDDSVRDVTNSQGVNITDFFFPSEAAPTVGQVFVSLNQDLIAFCGPVVNASGGEGLEDFYTFTVLYDAANFATSWASCYATANENWIGHTDTDYTIQIFSL